MVRKVPETVHIWMAMDLETRRVLVQTHPFAEDSFPRGLRGAGWPQRELDVDKTIFDGLLTNEIINEDADSVHRDWWDKAARKGHPRWPLVPGEDE